MSRPPLRGPIVIGLLILVALFAAWRAPSLTGPADAALGAEPRRIMGTTCRLLAVPPHTQPAAEAVRVAGSALRDAELALRAIEAEMSIFIAESPLSRLNSASAGHHVALPHDTVSVLRASLDAWHATDGAFDVTCRPLSKLWKEAARRRRSPTPEQIALTRSASRWRNIVLDAAGATRTSPDVEVDMGGIAKGYGIDRAVERMRAAGARGGLVEVGGDLRVFGMAPGGRAYWEVQLRNPYGEGTIASLEIRQGAVCTSGDYFRYVTIAGRRFSHILDPRTGYPVAAAHSVTVVAPDATSADVWATALSVLGRAGLSRLPAKHEALLVTGDPGKARALATRGFLAVIVQEPPFAVDVMDR